MTSPVVSRPALGFEVALGTLYDSRSDTFLSHSLFKETPANAVDSKAKASSTAKLSKATTFRQKLADLGVGTELGASILAGLSSIDGCGLYLADHHKTPGDVAQSSLHYTVTTVEEELNLTASGVKDLIIPDVLDSTSATHVVTGITWGAQFIVTARTKADDPTHVARLQQCLDKELESLLQAALEASHAIEFSSTELYDDGNSVLHDSILSVLDNGLAGDPRPPAAPSSTSFIHGLRSRLYATNDAQGKPIQYILMPVSLLSMLRLVDIQHQPVIHQPNIDYLTYFIQFLDDWADAQQKFNNYVVRCKNCPTAIPPDHLRLIVRKLRPVKTDEFAFKASFAEALKDVRYGKANEDRLHNLLVEAEGSELSPEKLRSMANHRGTLDFKDQMSSLGATYIGYGSTSLTTILSRGSYDDAFVLNFNSSLRNSREWDETIHLFEELSACKGHQTILIAVDADAVGHLLDKVYICQYRSGRVFIEDLLEHRKILASNCIMQYDQEWLDSSINTKPVQRRPVKVPCPHQDCDQTLHCQWICALCRSLVEYGHVDDRLYCDCGATPFDHWDFKCQDQRHGPRWTRYERPVLSQLLTNLKPFNELNILILGETGVGKSTWINAFVNYLSYDTLEDALQADDLKWVIPCSFSTQLKDDSDGRGKFVQKDIKIGSSKSEHDGARGQSATQSTAVYTVDIDNTRVRLIDTPGIGDTRGLEQDNKNMADILHVLRTYKKLHGILILLKPNASRLTVMFRFCIKQLLTQLHRNAATNIVFGFTNTRGSNYKPGDTFKPLEALLSSYTTVQLGLYEQNVYCFDSESFRYLAAQKKGIDMGLLEDNMRSWEYSVAECKRLVKYVGELAPHNVRSTINLNETRDLIIKLTEPMALIAQKIASSIAVNNDQIKQLQSAKLSRDELEKSLYIQRESVESYEVDAPRTICAHHDCVEVRSDFQGRDETVVVYKQMCHKPCGLGNSVKRNTKGDPALKQCWAMQNDFCKMCGHNYMDHMHIYYDYRSMTYKYKDKNIAQDLIERATRLELQQKAIDMRKEAVAEFKLEYAQVQEAAIQFGFFLKRHAIEPYNDATIEYVDHLINQERLKIKSGGKKDTLEMLEKYKAEHIQKVKVLTEAMDRGDSDRVVDDQGVRQLVDSLYGLPHFGEDLRRIVTVNEKAAEGSFRERSYNVSAGSHWKGTSKKLTVRRKKNESRLMAMSNRFAPLASMSGHGPMSGGYSHELIHVPNEGRLGREGSPVLHHEVVHVSHEGRLRGEGGPTAMEMDSHWDPTVTIRLQASRLARFLGFGGNASG
ncbi:uncharacterized protein B0T23DRAFT_363533 [Neurospora hispaniola]|uniref:G domain-containing protein n=1 Tax=Neurospora hispaniola TaxID=588809 RepID=A0AAJ0I1F4_9PEZI|nr:hypothetical protein B0T23DRAFT_363533 [Neurospora hispaniola]